MKIKFISGLLVIIVSLFIIYGFIFAESLENDDFIETTNYANNRIKFFYYIPEKILANKDKLYPVLVCIPSLNGSGWKFVTAQIKDFADAEGFVVLAPNFRFNDQDHQNQMSYLYPTAWSGDALIQMVNKVARDQNLSITNYYLYGFSAGASFALRFAFYQPDLTKAVSAHASIANIIPENKNFVKFFISSGKGDQSALEMTEKYYVTAVEKGIDVTFKSYEGGHSLPLQQTVDTLDFFKKANDESNKTFDFKLIISIVFLFGIAYIVSLMFKKEQKMFK